MAYYEQEPSITTISDGLMTPLGMISTMFLKLSLILGIMFILIAWIRYLRYRRNPLQTPISDVWLILILGLVLTAAPFVSRWAVGHQIITQYQHFTK